MAPPPTTKVGWKLGRRSSSRSTVAPSWGARGRTRDTSCSGGDFAISSSVPWAISARYWEDRGEWERAADCYERGIEVDHLAEGLYRRLMLCYREADRITQAIDIYDRLRSTLEAEGSAEPARETTVIYRRMVDRL